jgi:hypothetical protein
MSKALKLILIGAVLLFSCCIDKVVYAQGGDESVDEWEIIDEEEVIDEWEIIDEEVDLPPDETESANTPPDPTPDPSPVPQPLPPTQADGGIARPPAITFIPSYESLFNDGNHPSLVALAYMISLPNVPLHPLVRRELLFRREVAGDHSPEDTLGISSELPSIGTFEPEEFRRLLSEEIR